MQPARRLDGTTLMCDPAGQLPGHRASSRKLTPQRGWFGSVVCMSEEPRATDPGPAPTSKTTETRTETTEFQTSSDVRTSTSAKEEDVRGQGEEATDDQRDRQDEDARGQGEEVRDDQRDPGDAPQGSSLGSKLGNKLGLGHHGDQADRDETE
jgi:hypothetical protein